MTPQEILQINCGTGFPGHQWKQDKLHSANTDTVIWRTYCTRCALIAKKAEFTSEQNARMLDREAERFFVGIFFVATFIICVILIRWIF